MLENDCGGSGGVINDGDFVNVLSVDEFFDDGSGMEDSFLEVVEIKVVRLTEGFELPLTLSCEDRGRTATESSVVEACYGGVVVGEF